MKQLAFREKLVRFHRDDYILRVDEDCIVDVEL